MDKLSKITKQNNIHITNLCLEKLPGENSKCYFTFLKLLSSSLAAEKKEIL